MTVFAVGIGKAGWVGVEEINGLANDPDNQYAFFLEGENDINGTADNILDAICNS